MISCQFYTMKLLVSIQWLRELFAGVKRSDRLHQLQQQRYLQHQGIETTAEVMEALLFDEKAGNLLAIRLWVKLKKPDGTFIYTHTNTLASLKQVPARGETVRVKYLPGNLSAILLL